MSSGVPNKPIESYPVADLGDLPQPPEPGPGAASAPAGSAPVASAAALPQAAVLQFLEPDAVRAVVPLQFPFKLDDAEIREITVRRLSGAEVGALADAHRDGVELFDFYAAMSSLPKPVLRGLIDDDLEAFLEKARPFLCPFARDSFLPSTGTNGAGSSDAPAAPSANPGPAP